MQGVDCTLGKLCPSSPLSTLFRFSPLWPAAGEALATGFDTYPALAWPLILGQLGAAQSAFLAGDIGPNRSSVQQGEAADALPQHQQQQGEPPLLPARFAAAVAAGGEAATGGATDAAVRLNQLLRALAKAGHAGVEAKAKDWVPLLLAYCGAKSASGDAAGEGEEAVEEEAEGGDAGKAAGGSGGEEVEQAEGEPEEEQQPGQQQLGAGVSARAWRGGLREWLAVLGGLRGVRGMWGGDAVQRAVAAQLMSPDPYVQLAALRCLKAFRLKFLLPYADSLARLADNKVRMAACVMCEGRWGHVETACLFWLDMCTSKAG